MPKFLVRQYVSQWFAGVERFYFYTSGISGQPMKQAFYGFVEGDGQPTPNVAAYAAMTGLLDDATPDQRSAHRAQGPDLWVYPFTTPRGTILVACARTGTAQQLSLPNATRCCDLMGAERSVPKDGKLTVADAPMYVLVKDG